MKRNRDDLRDFFLGCRNPLIVDSKRGPVLVSCGKCGECLRRKSSRNTINGIIESQGSAYCFFVTLTYNDVNLPIVRLFKNDYRDGVIDCVDWTVRRVHPRNKKSKLKKSSSYGNKLFEIYSSFGDPLFKDFYRKSHKKSKYFKPRRYKYISVLRKSDLQKFIKRLRFSIAKRYDAELRYFACGEYGPKHFRPHYHLLLFFDEPRLLTELQDLVNTCWQFGASYCEPSFNRNGVASYAAGYLSDFASLPSFLKHKSVAPFILHSLYFGKKYYKDVFPYIKAFDKYPFEHFTVSTDFGICSVSLQSSIKSYLFPRCYDYVDKISRVNSKLYSLIRLKIGDPSVAEYYGLLPFSEFSLRSEFVRTDFFKIYNLFPYLSSKYGTTHCFNLARYYLLSESSYHYLLDIPDDLNYNQYECARDDIDDLHIRYLLKVYTAIRLSKLAYDNSRLLDLSFVDYLFKLIDFYYQLEQYRLSNQYNLQNDYNVRYDSDDYTLFYYLNGDVDYEDLFSNSDIINQFKTDSSIELAERRKHKELNDENDIFVLL